MPLDLVFPLPNGNKVPISEADYVANVILMWELIVCGYMYIGQSKRKVNHQTLCETGMDENWNAKVRDIKGYWEV